MGRKASVRFDKTRGYFVTSALGATRTTQSGRDYKPLTCWTDLTDAIRDLPTATLRLQHLLAQEHHQQPEPVYATDISFRQLSEFYLEDSEKLQRMGTEALQVAISNLTAFGSWRPPSSALIIDQLPARLVTEAHLKDWVASLVARKLSASYVTQSLLKVVRTVFKWATNVSPGVYPGLPLAVDPGLRVKGPRILRRKLREERPEHVQAFLVWCLKRAGKRTGLNRRFARTLIGLLICLRSSGARPKEICNARWDQWSVEQDGWSVLILDHWKNSKKCGTDRVIALPPSCTRFIQWIAKQPGHHPELIFTHAMRREGGQYKPGDVRAGESWINSKGSIKNLCTTVQEMKNAAIKDGVPLDPDFTLYWLRSMFTTQARLQGIAPAVLAESLGTSEAMLSRHYTDITKNHVLESMRKLRGTG